MIVCMCNSSSFIHSFCFVTCLTVYTWQHYSWKYSQPCKVIKAIIIKCITDLPNRQDAVRGNSVPSPPFLLITTIFPSKGILKQLTLFNKHKRQHLKKKKPPWLVNYCIHVDKSLHSNVSWISNIRSAHGQRHLKHYITGKNYRYKSTFNLVIATDWNHIHWK